MHSFGLNRLRGNKPLIAILISGLISLPLVAGIDIGNLNTLQWPNVNGSPTYDYYEAESLGAHQGINSIDVDPLGRLLITSANRIIVYDGNEWLTYLQKENQTPKIENLYTTITSQQGQIICGTESGIFEITFEADLKYQVSPVSGCLESSLNMSALRRSFKDANQIYFFGNHSIYQYDSDTNQISELDSDGKPIASLGAHGGSLYLFSVYEKNLRRSGQKWEPIHPFADTRVGETIRNCKNWQGKGLFLSSENGGIYKLADNKIEYWNSEIDELPSNYVLDMEPLSEDYLVVSVQSRGLYVVNKAGQIVQALSKTINHKFGEIRKLVHVGNQTIWGATDKGIIKVQWLKPLTNIAHLYDYPLNYPSIFSHRGSLHIVSGSKLAKLKRFEGSGFAGFSYRNVNWVQTALSVKEGILCGGQKGITLLKDDDTTETVASISDVNLLIQDPNNDNQVIACSSKALSILVRKEGRWSYSGRSETSKFQSHYSLTDARGNLWVEQGSAKVCKIETQSGSFDVTFFGKSDGFIPEWINSWKYQDNVIFSSGKGDVYVFWDYHKSKFTDLGKEVFDDIHRQFPGVGRPCEDTLGNLWIPTDSSHLVLRRQPNGEYVRDFDTLRSLRNFSLTMMLPSQNGVVWIFGSNSIYRFDPSKSQELDFSPETKLVSIEDIKYQKLLAPYGSPLRSVTIPYENNDLVVRFTTPTISTNEPAIHEFKIDSRTDEWQSLSSQDSIPLVNLREGNYTLHIRSKIAGRTGKELRINLTVNPPFYRTMTAYLCYLFISVFLLYFTIFLIRLNDRKNGLRLQRLVDFRTRELESANQELSTMVRKAESAIAAKRTFLGGISHEIRTPLNAILGPIQLLNETEDPKEIKQYLSFIDDASRHLLKLFAELMQFVEKGMPSRDSDFVEFNLRELIEELHSEFQKGADERGISFHWNIESQLQDYWLGDLSKLKQAIRILLDNAFKFTAKGHVKITVIQNKARISDKYILDISVSDTGIGIKPEILSSVFEPFQQGLHDSGLKIDGTGIGLSLCKQLVNTMGGDVSVVSDPQQSPGSIFTISLPLKPSKWHSSYRNEENLDHHKYHI